jgi:hypothetical protein
MGKINERLVRFVAKDAVIKKYNQKDMSSIKDIIDWYSGLYSKKNSEERGNSEAKVPSVRSVATQTLFLQTREINIKESNKLLNREDSQVNKKKKSSPAEDTNSEVRKTSKRGEFLYTEICKAKEHPNKELISDNVCSECANGEEWQVYTRRRKDKNELRKEKEEAVGRR